MPHSVLVTGGAGFIGSALVRHLIRHTDARVVNVDKLTYAGHLSTVASVANDPRYQFVQADVADAGAMARAMAEYRPSVVLHLAAESHVDRSIDGPAAFIQTNLVGTYTLLEAARSYWQALPEAEQAAFRFVQVSTDEVYGALGETGHFREDTPYRPTSPYSASKAGADHLVRAWHHTYGLPTLVTNCSNNYGPYQYPEKLIPVIILKAIAGEPIPVYGTGQNVRDWLFVDDHVRALWTVARHGQVGATYVVGGQSERRNLEVVEAACTLLDELLPRAAGPHADLITFVTDRPGHDWRYAIDPSRLQDELDWRPRETFESGLRATVQWYLDHQDWCQTVLRDARSPQRRGLHTAPPAGEAPA